MNSPSNSEETSTNAPGDGEAEQAQSSSTAERDSVQELYEKVFGQPVLPIDAFAHGRKVGRRVAQLFPERMMHVLSGIRKGITEIRERRGEVGQ